MSVPPGLLTQLRHSLARSQVFTAEDLDRMTVEELRSIRNLGKRCVEIILEYRQSGRSEELIIDRVQRDAVPILDWIELAVLSLRYEDPARTVREAADTLQMSPAALHVIECKALLKLRRLLIRIRQRPRLAAELGYTVVPCGPDGQAQP